MLATELAGLKLAHPIGLAAGFDKNGQVYNPLFTIGFSFVEIGSITPKPQPGNPRPRVFRLDQDAAVINRYGFNNDGFDALAARLTANPPISVLGINLGKNKDQTHASTDYAAGIERFAGLAHYLAINLSSPNTPGLRHLQSDGVLHAFLSALQDSRMQSGASKIFLKIAPDLDDREIDAIVDCCLRFSLAGLIIGNTTVSRPADLKSHQRAELGGLSGAPLFELSTDRLRMAAGLAKGRFALIGAGGIANADQAYKKIRAGASALQLYTGLVYRGPGLLQELLCGLQRMLVRDGFRTLGEAVGADLT